MSQESPIDVAALWKKVNMELRKGEVDRSLWEAADKAQPLLIEGDMLVLGLAPSEMRYASYLTTAAKRARIQAILQNLIGRPIELQVIEGTTGEDWEKYKQRHHIGTDRLAEETQYRVEHKGALGVWDQLAIDLYKIYTEMPHRRGFPEQQARLLLRSLPVIAEAEDKAKEIEPEACQLHFTQLNRAFDKLATYTDIPAPVIALEYLRYRNACPKSQQNAT